MLSTQLQRYGVAVLSIALTLLLVFWMNIGPPFLLFLPAVVVSAWYGGQGPGLLASTLAATVSSYFFLTPASSFLINDLKQGLQLGLFVLEGGALSWLIGKLQFSKNRAEGALKQTSVDMKKVEQRLTELETSRSLAQIVLDHAPTIICVGDLEGRYQFVNAQYDQVFGQSGKALVGRPLAEILPSAQAAIILKEIQTVTAAGQAMTFEEDIALSDGIHTHVKLKFPLKDSSGEIYAIGTIFLDIADRKQIELALRHKNEALEEVSRLKSEFIANMSHELRTPLTSILGFSSVLLQQIFGSLTAKQQEYLSHIRSSGTHLLNLINALLDLSKIEAGKLELNLEVVNLAELCQAALQMVEVAAQEKQQQLRLELPVVRETVLVDRQRVTQMLLNYLSNAVKFTPKRGTITLSSRLAASQELRTQSSSFRATNEATCFLVLSVSDTGIGIPSEKQHLLFQLFQQVNGAVNRQYEGTGLGLALTRLLAELHGGTVSFTSIPNEGSTFSVWLPLLAEEDLPEQ